MEPFRPAIDLTAAVTTPENISFEYQLAGPFRRLPAMLLDVFIRWIAVFLFIYLVLLIGVSGLASILPSSQALLSATFLIGIFLLSWFYGLFFEAWWNGQTPGKRILGLRVVSIDGRPINGAQATIRNFVRVADFFPYAPSLVFGFESDFFAIPTFIVAMSCMLMTRRFQRLGDLAAGTMVVVDERTWSPKKIALEDPRMASLAEFIPANFRMSPSMAKTIALYVERRPKMSLRRREITAAILSVPLMQRFGFRTDTSSDLLLCAVYYREYFLDNSNQEHPRTVFNGSPIADSDSSKESPTQLDTPSSLARVGS